MSNTTETCIELLNITEQQAEVIAQKDNLIKKLVNENLEQENMINTLLKDMQVE